MILDFSVSKGSGSAAAVQPQSHPILATFANGVPSNEIVQDSVFSVFTSAEGQPQSLGHRYVSMTRKRPDAGAGDDDDTETDDLSVPAAVVSDGMCTNGVNGEQPFTKYLVGVVERKTGKVRVVEAMGLMGIFQHLQDKREASQKDSAAAPSDNRMLISEFGSKKKQRDMVSKANYSVSVDHTHGLPTLSKHVEQVTTSQPSAASLEEDFSASAADRLPPINLGAKTPKEALPLPALVPRAELSLCPGTDLLEAAMSKAITGQWFSFSQFIVDRLLTLEERRSADKLRSLECRILQYLGYLLYFYRHPSLMPQRQSDSSRSAQPEPPADEKTARNRDADTTIPDAVLRPVFRRFTDLVASRDGKHFRHRTTDKSNLLVMYILCIAMNICEFQMRKTLVLLARDMKLATVKLLAFCKAMGFTIERVRVLAPCVSDGAAVDQTVSDDEARQIVHVTVPLSLPPLPQKRSGPRA